MGMRVLSTAVHGQSLRSISSESSVNANCILTYNCCVLLYFGREGWFPNGDPSFLPLTPIICRGERISRSYT